jgi:hypothetical protein
MGTFRVVMKSLENGQFVADWFDDDQRLWDDERLHKGVSIISAWVAPHLKAFRRTGAGTDAATDVVFNPNGIAVSSSARDKLRDLPGVEFLPVDIEGRGQFFVIHVTKLSDVTPGVTARRAPPPSGNIVELQAFPADYAAPGPLFRVRQPPDSAAGNKGYCLDTIYANDEGARALEAACGVYLDLVPWDDRRDSYARIRSSDTRR